MNKTNIISAHGGPRRPGVYYIARTVEEYKQARIVDLSYSAMGFGTCIVVLLLLGGFFIWIDRY
jgi:hypothetical protein